MGSIKSILFNYIHFYSHSEIEPRSLCVCVCVCVCVFVVPTYTCQLELPVEIVIIKNLRTFNMREVEFVFLVEGSNQAHVHSKEPQAQ